MFPGNEQLEGLKTLSVFVPNCPYVLLPHPRTVPSCFKRRLCVFLAENDQWRLAAQSGSEAVSKKFDKEINIKVLNEALRGL